MLPSGTWVVVTADAFRALVLDRFGIPAPGEVAAWQARIRGELALPEELLRGAKRTFP